MKETKSTCILCGKEKGNHLMAKHRNDNMSSSLGFCKACLNNKKIVNDKDKVIDVMRMMNLPYLEDIWNDAIEKGGDKTFSKYIQVISPKRDFKDYSDSSILNKTEAHSSGFDKNAPVDNKKLVAKWGKVEDEEEYELLEISYSNLCEIKPPATVLDEKRYTQVVMLERKVKEAMEGGDHRAISTYKKLYETSLKDLGLDIDASDRDEETIIGLRIKSWERNAPVPEDEKTKDIDNIGEYIKQWFYIPMKRVLGRATEEEVASLYEQIN